MIEETTTGVSNYNDIHVTFEQSKDVAVAKLLESIQETLAEISRMSLSGDSVEPGP